MNKEELKQEIASLSKFQARIALNLIAEGRTFSDAIRIAKGYYRTKGVGPSEVKR